MRNRPMFPVWTRLRLDYALQEAMKEIAGLKVVRVSSLIRQVLRDYAENELGRRISADEPKGGRRG